MKKRTLILAGMAFFLAAAAARAHGYKLGEIAIGHPYARSTAPGQPNGGAYLRLENRGPDDRLLSATTAIAQRVELHNMQMEGDVMRMRQVDAIELPTNQAVVLQPGGMHLMLIGLKTPLKEGDRFAMTLKFQKAGEATVDVVVQSPDKH